MKRVACIATIGATAFFGSVSMSTSPASQEAGVIGVALTKLEIPERVSAPACPQHCSNEPRTRSCQAVACVGDK